MAVSDAAKALLRDLGYMLWKAPNSDGMWFWFKAPNDMPTGAVRWSLDESDAWAAALAHAESEDGLQANFHKAVRLLCADEMGVEIYPLDGGTWRCTVSPMMHPIAKDREGATPEAAAFALLRKVRSA